jgi:hypothetical protein
MREDIMEENNGNNLPEVLEGDLVVQEQDVISMAERSIDRWQRVIGIALKITTHRDWVNQNGNPYLVHSGAERIARQFRVSITNVRKEKIWSEDEKGERYYMWVYDGTVSIPSLGSQSAVGNCSSRDTLYGMKNKEFKPLSQIDEPSVMKAAHTNLIVNGITHMLGLRNLTWEQLEQAGIDTDKIQKVEYEAGGKGGSQEKNLPEKAKKKRDEMKKWIFEMCNGDIEASQNDMIERSTWVSKKDGKEEVVKGRLINQWTEKQINMHYEKIKKEYEDFIASVSK